MALLFKAFGPRWHKFPDSTTIKYIWIGFMSFFTASFFDWRYLSCNFINALYRLQSPTFILKTHPPSFKSFHQFGIFAVVHAVIATLSYLCLKNVTSYQKCNYKNLITDHQSSLVHSTSAAGISYCYHYSEGGENYHPLILPPGWITLCQSLYCILFWWWENFEVMLGQMLNHSV
jgi:hypothetical protein